jgi:hypothetical protein
MHDSLTAWTSEWTSEWTTHRRAYRRTYRLRKAVGGSSLCVYMSVGVLWLGLYSYGTRLYWYMKKSQLNRLKCRYRYFRSGYLTLGYDSYCLHCIELSLCVRLRVLIRYSYGTCMSNRYLDRDFRLHFITPLDPRRSTNLSTSKNSPFFAFFFSSPFLYLWFFAFAFFQMKVVWFLKFAQWWLLWRTWRVNK